MRARGAVRLTAALIAVSAGGASAQPVVVSAAPETVAVTLYRDPDRGAGDAINAGLPNGYALVTETRTVAIPAGRAVIRFEGVASGMLAESAILADLPGGVAERNLDADLLSPRTLYDRSLNRPVTVTRTLPDGRVETVAAVIRSAASGAIVVQTREGVEALGCSGLPEALTYTAVPAGLSARPTLSVETESAAAATATVTLSYLAFGFDWSAHYVVDLGEDGRARLFAWATLASGDETSFADARTVVVAGQVNRGDRSRERPWRPDGELVLRCVQLGAPPPPPPPPPMVAAPMAEMGDIVVTAARVSRTAVQEELGDLKLYRVPFPTTVAARSVKQVAMIERAGVPVRLVHRSIVSGERVETEVLLRTRNRAEDGLGLPLPAGAVAVFRRASTGDRLLAGEGRLPDRAVGEDVEIAVATSSAVTAGVELDEDGTSTLTVRNANPWPVAYEAELSGDPDERVRAVTGRLVREDGAMLWRTSVPANGTVRLRYRVTSAD